MGKKVIYLTMTKLLQRIHINRDRLRLETIIRINWVQCCIYKSCFKGKITLKKSQCSFPPTHLGHQIVQNKATEPQDKRTSNIN